MFWHPNHWSIKAKAFAASTIFALCLLGLASNAFITLSYWDRGLEHLSSSTLPEQTQARDLRDRVKALQLDVFRYAAWANNGVDPTLLTDLQFDIHAQFNLIGHDLEQVAAGAKLANPDWASEILAGWKDYVQAASDTIEIARGDSPMGTMMLGGTDDRARRVDNSLLKMSETVAAEAQRSTQTLMAEANRGKLLFMIIGTAGIVLGLAVTMLIARSIAGPVEAVTAVMVRIARGETVELQVDDRSDEIGQMVVAISSFRDKIERDHRTLVQREEQLAIQNLRFDAAISNMSQGLAMFDRDRKLIVCNSRYAEIYGLPPKLMRPGTTQREVLEHRVAAGIFDGSDPAKYIEDRVKNAIRAVDSDTILELSDGRVIAVCHRAMPDGGWVSTHQDVTEQQRVKRRIAHMATHDQLTGLPNRNHFHECMSHAFARVNRGEAIAIHFIDLDCFKPVNDSLGHAAGDQLLKEVAARLQRSVRETDIVARLGGDEFAIIQADLEHPNDAALLAERIVRAVDEPVQIDSNRVHVGASVGIAVGPSDANTAEDLLKHADAALYSAKAAGRRTYRFFKPEMNIQFEARRRLEQELRDALLNGEFELYYQPVVSVATKKVNGFEALLRWNHPERGLVGPNEFIPLAEETGLINAIGDWVLREACSEAATWPEHLYIAVNISAVQMRGGGLVQGVANTLARCRLTPGRLELEVTETVLLADEQATALTLQQLRAIGVRIVMDDFGTGYSGLNYLRRYLFDKIKIDRSFIGELSYRPDCATIICAVLGMAAALNITTTAEGIESEAQLEQLLKDGCNEAQGYLFSKPRPASELASLIRRLQENVVAA